MISLKPTDIVSAHERIKPFIRPTYLDYSAALSEETGGAVWLKCENLQHTGSFKVRGALNIILSLTADSAPEEPPRFITASTGNHGAAVGYATKQIGGQAVVFTPENASPTKLQNIARWGAEIRHFGQDGVEAERKARQVAEADNLPFISPYNDPAVVAGQGTIGVEFAAQNDPADVVYVALGGGGLISGIAVYLKSVWPNCRIIGCSPENSAVMIHSQAAGRILDLPSKPTLSDGTAGGVEAESLTFELCRQFVDGYEMVTEAEIAAAMRLIIGREHQLIEGAAGVAVAALLKQKQRLSNQKAIVVLCGGNVASETLKTIL